MRVVAGLGNPGLAYAGHRHNVGFMAVDRIASAYAFEPWRARFQGAVAEGRVGVHRLLLLKPATYMNESGRAVGAALGFYKLELDALIAVHDELDLAPGRVKVKTGGGAGGHNGLRSISAHLGPDYARVRLGIGHPGHKDAVTPYVLGDFARSDREWVADMLDAVAAELPWLLDGNAPRFMNEVARRTGAGE